MAGIDMAVEHWSVSTDNDSVRVELDDVGNDFAFFEEVEAYTVVCPMSHLASIPGFNEESCIVDSGASHTAMVTSAVCLPCFMYAMNVTTIPCYALHHRSIAGMICDCSDVPQLDSQCCLRMHMAQEDSMGPDVVSMTFASERGIQVIQPVSPPASALAPIQGGALRRQRPSLRPTELQFLLIDSGAYRHCCPLAWATHCELQPYPSNGPIVTT